MNKKTKEEKIKLSENITKKIKELNELEVSTELIKDNKIEFSHKEKNYRVRKPNLKEKEDMRNKQNKKYIDLLDDDSFVLRQQLITKLKKKGIDIDAMDRKIKSLDAEIENVQMKLVPIDDKKTREVLKKEIIDLDNQRRLIDIDIKEYLSPCIENELAEFGNLYLIYTLLEKEIDDTSIDVKEGDEYPKKWVRVFDSYDEFLKTEEDDLISKAAYYISLIIFKKEL
jgi:hypothetical protein